jgi:hypothetical protein
VKKRPHWNEQSVDKMVQDAWAQLPQRWISELTGSVLQKLQDCIDSRGPDGAHEIV